eukprot:c26592_g1_i1 orf=133-1260(+)
MSSQQMCSAPSFVMMVLLLWQLVPNTGADTVKGGYWYHGSGLSASDLDATPFTHILYAFASMDNSTFVVQPSSDDDDQIASFSATVRRSNPSVKTLISIGGGGSNADAFSTMASDSSSRQIFIQSSINLANQNGFDGLDLDWEFPQSNTDMDNLGILFSEWRQAATSNSSTTPFLLTAAVHYNVTISDSESTYPVESISENLDWINLMEYDLHGSWEPHKTGEHTALYDTTPNGELCINYGVTHWLAAGLPSQRGALGLAMYGRTWYLQDPAQHGVGAPATGAGPGDGTYTYDEIQQFKQSSNVSCEDDNTTKSAYCYGGTSNGTLWVGYDDTTTIGVKVEYLKSEQLRGYAFWSLNSDQHEALAKQASLTIEGN